ncbi:hypothetical protein [Agrobacterium tumefaciens]|uniref:hypothetical protein n=1 Tax=Agrobacterium tumefaciens TaxID=358 RepID=UPI001571969B|nr:hypothetical protein [Agrobacterium tumefaciens]
MAKPTSRTVNLKIAYQTGRIEGMARSVRREGGPSLHADAIIQIARTATPDFKAEIKDGRYSKLDDRFREMFGAEPEITRTYVIAEMFKEAFLILYRERRAANLKAAEKAKRAEQKNRRQVWA